MAGGKKRLAEAPADVEEDSIDTSSTGSEDFPEVAVTRCDNLQSNILMQVSDDQASGEEDAGGELIDVDFEFFEPAERDFHGIKTLLTPLFDGQPLNSSQLADFILQQVRTGLADVGWYHLCATARGWDGHKDGRRGGVFGVGHDHPRCRQAGVCSGY